MKLYTLVLLFYANFVVQAAPVECNKLAELSKLMAGKLNESKNYQNIDFSSSHKVTYISDPLIADKNVSETITDYDSYIVKRVSIDFAGNRKIERLKLTKEEFYFRIKLVDEYITEWNQLPISPIILRNVGEVERY